MAVGILVVGLAWRAAPVIQFFLREQTLIRHGNIVVKKITDYEAAHGHPPDGLHEIGIQEGPSPVDMEGPIFYQRQGQNFELWFSDLDITVSYHSKDKHWN